MTNLFVNGDAEDPNGYDETGIIDGIPVINGDVTISSAYPTYFSSESNVWKLGSTVSGCYVAWGSTKLTAGQRYPITIVVKQLAGDASPYTPSFSDLFIIIADESLTPATMKGFRFLDAMHAPTTNYNVFPFSTFPVPAPAGMYIDYAPTLGQWYVLQTSFVAPVHAVAVVFVIDTGRSVSAEWIVDKIFVPGRDFAVENGKSPHSGRRWDFDDIEGSLHPEEDMRLDRKLRRRAREHVDALDADDLNLDHRIRHERDLDPL